MTKQTPQSAVFDLQNMVDMKGYEDAFNTATRMNERMASIALEAGNRATDVASATTKEALANMRDLTQRRDDPAVYAQAFAEFAQKQTELFTRTVQAFASDMQKAGTEASDLASKTGEEVAGKMTKATEGTAQKVTAAAKKAA